VSFFLSDGNFLVDANESIGDTNILVDASEFIGDGSVVEKSKEIVERLKPPEELFNLLVEYAGDSFQASMELFVLHPGVLIIIGALALGIKFFLMPHFKFIPKILDLPISFVLAIAVYGFVSPFILPEIIKIMG